MHSGRLSVWPWAAEWPLADLTEEGCRGAGSPRGTAGKSHPGRLQDRILCAASMTENCWGRANISQKAVGARCGPAAARF